MLYYQFVTNLKVDFDDESSRHERSRYEQEQDRHADFGMRTEMFNKQLKGRVSCYISYIKGTRAVGGVLLKEKMDVKPLVVEFLSCLELPHEGLTVKEVDGNIAERSLRTADSNDYIEDDDTFGAPFGLLCREFHWIDYREELLPEKVSRRQVKKHAKDILWEESLAPELERIFRGSTQTCVAGHPVHYLIEVDSEEVLTDVSETLLSALYDAGRLQSRRYAYVDGKGNQRGSKVVYNKFWQRMKCGAVVVDFPELVEDEFSFGDSDTVIKMCYAMKKNHAGTLNIIAIPKGSSKIKQMLYDNLEGLTFVELMEDTAFSGRAKSYLRGKAEERGIKPNKELYKFFQDPSKGFRPGELNRIFEAWYSAEMKRHIYPQYADMLTIANKEAKEEAKGSAYQELQGMIGLTEAKKVIQQALDFYKAQKVMSMRGINGDRPAMHMVFTGAPGTAKTTAARLFARIMRENGLLSVGDLVEVGRADLVGKYVGWTAQIVKQKFKQANGSVLFIDEAYSLVEDKGGLFGDEAINTIVQEMENHRGDMVVIFAGYSDRMEEFLARNPGLRSRIAFHVPFADYSAEELYSITELMAKKQKLTLADGVQDKLLPIYDRAREEPDFGNGRFARNVLERARMNLSSRIISQDIDKLTDEDMTTLIAEDFEVLLPRTATPQKRTIGFAV